MKMLNTRRLPSAAWQTIPTPKQRAPHTLGKEYAVFAAAVKRRANYACEQCGARDVRVFADHIIEVVDGGSNDLSNGQCLCNRCHVIKTNKQRALRAADLTTPIVNRTGEMGG